MLCFKRCTAALAALAVLMLGSGRARQHWIIIDVEAGRRWPPDG